VNRIPSFSRDAARVGPITKRDVNTRCIWRDCNAQQAEDIPVCLDHGLRIAAQIMHMMRSRDEKPADAAEWPSDEEYWALGEPPQHFVYYLMISPTTVKIGTSRQLWQRIRSLRSEMQYVVALERGGRELERRRHLEFADERRHKQREDFELSDRLKQHIDALQPQRDELVRIATTDWVEGDTPIPPVVVNE
jgi:hypothetical protein